MMMNKRAGERGVEKEARGRSREAEGGPELAGRRKEAETS